ncbi:hypothetical protein A2U01_0012478 [Trifolium medium]|uniref:Uncharacterized protein n=1 Tax=Trifolium medium TaxID=97028 RepID=A0A392MVN1_9FABA|nr:hypothetical protein [Trifolium medium]
MPSQTEIQPSIHGSSTVEKVDLHELIRWKTVRSRNLSPPLLFGVFIAIFTAANMTR